MSEQTPVVSAELVAPLYQARGWVRAAGVAIIFHGLLLGMTQIGLLLAWVPVWLGIVAFGIANAAETAHESDDPASITLMNRRLRLFFQILAALAIVGLLFGFAFLILGGGESGLGPERMPSPGAPPAQ